MNIVTILMMPAKLPTPDRLKIKILQNKGYDVIIPDYDVCNKILLSESNYFLDVFMWPKFVNSSISLKEVIKTSLLSWFDQKKNFFFEGYWCWFKFNNLGLALSMTIKFYTNVAKRLKLKLRMFWELIRTFVEVTGKKLVRGTFLLSPHPPLSILIRVKNKQTRSFDADQ